MTESGVVRFELTISGFRRRRNSRLSHTLRDSQRAPSGSRTRTSALARQQAAATSWVQYELPNCQRSNSSEHRVGLEPTLPHYGCGVLAAEPPVHRVFQWDQTDLNRHLPG